MTREQLDEHIRRMVADWPPFTPKQETRLANLLRPGVEAVAAERAAARRRSTTRQAA
jgi:hypothetical protein